MAGKFAKLIPLGLSGALLACTPTGSEQEQRVAQLEREVATLSAETASLRSELGELREKLDQRSERQERLDELREKRERRRAQLGRPDLRDPFGDAGSAVDPGPPTPLPMKGSKAPEDEGPDPIETFVDTVSCETGKCSFSRKALEAVLANPASLSKSARVVPAIREGETKGFKLYGIRPRSLPKALGLKNGDLIVAVNGHPLAGLDQAMELYTKLRDAQTIELLIERKGKRHTLELTAK